MTHLVRSVSALLIVFALFFNLERLDVQQENIVDIASFVYVSTLVSAVLTIRLPLLRQARAAVVILLWLNLYVILKLLFWQFFQSHPPLGGIYTYLTFTEVAMVIIISWLAHNVGSALQEFEETVRRITFSSNNSKRIQQLENADEDIRIEMFRSRHNHHPMSVIIVEPRPESIQASVHRLAYEAQQKMMSSYITNTMAQSLGKYLRQTDMILEQVDRKRFLVLCPETPAADARLLVEYIQSVAADQLGISVVSGMATFPEEAVTFEELVTRAEKNLRSANGIKPNMLKVAA